MSNVRMNLPAVWMKSKLSIGPTPARPGPTPPIEAAAQLVLVHVDHDDVVALPRKPLCHVEPEDPRADDDNLRGTPPRSRRVCPCC